MSTHRIRTDPIERAVADLAAGRPVVVLDAADREHEGDLIMAAQFATTHTLGLFVRYGSGFVCAPMPDDVADRLGLPLMVTRPQDSMGTAFTVTVDAAEGVSTGISAADRAHTLRLLADSGTTREALVRPGHVLPLRANSGGVLTRPGHTEACVDMLNLAGLTPVGVIVELVEDDGEMRRADSCRAFADENGLALVTIEDLRTHLQARADLERSGPAQAAVARHSSSRLPTAEGEFVAVGYRDPRGIEHVALVLGEVSADGAPVPVRVHSECLTGDVFGSQRCDCGPQLHSAMQRIQQEGRGVVVYLCGHEGRGIGLVAKLAAYALQEDGQDTVDANLSLGLPVDSRDYAVGAAILADLGVRQVRLLTNNPAKVDGLRAHGVDVVEREGVVVTPTTDNMTYLETKRRRMGHDLPSALGLTGGVPR